MHFKRPIPLAIVLMFTIAACKKKGDPAPDGVDVYVAGATNTIDNTK